MSDMGTGREQAEQLFAQLAAAGNYSGDEEDHDLEPKVVTGDDRHIFVGFTLKGKGVWLAPDDARSFGEELLDAADEAEAIRAWHPRR